MRILVLGAPMLNDALRRLGAQIFFLGQSPTADRVVTTPVMTRRLLALLSEEGFLPDVVLYADDGNLPFLLSPWELPFPCVFFSIDTFCNPWHVSYASGFDAVFCAQKDLLPLFSDEGLRAVWFPLFCQETMLEKAMSMEETRVRDIPVSFVGTLAHKNNPKRLPFLEAFKEEHPLFVREGDFVPVFLRSRIVLNQTAFSEVNFRCFEAMALGAALLMERCENGLAELFSDEELLPRYERGNAREAALIARLSLQKPALLRERAGNGQKAVALRHTDTVRARLLLAFFETLLSENAVEKRRTEESRRSCLVRGAFEMLAADLGPGMEEYIRFFHAVANGALPKRRP
ncbi:MAG: glycosyltransferase [Desulfovibrio sp.]|nr:glycosyltransferase [Desulfovibrio sp.]